MTLICRGSLLVTVVAMSICWGQPALRSQNPVVNSASYRTPGLPGSGIAQGSIFSIFGTGLGPPAPVQADKFPLPTLLGKSFVSVTMGGTTTQAIVLFAYSTQINALLPSNTPMGAGTLTVTYDGQTSAPVAVQVTGGAFGIYTYTSTGFGQAIATFPDYRLNTIIQAFHPGDYAVLWGTGLGPIAGDDAYAPPVGDLPGAVKVRVGNVTATVHYHGRSGCCSGLDQIVIEVPPGVQGCHVPVSVEAGDAVSNVATLAISATGQTCTDSLMGQDLVEKLAAGEKVDFGYVRLESLIAPFTGGGGARAGQDIAAATFSEYTPQTAGRAAYGVSSGYCVVIDCPNGLGCPTAGGIGMLSDSGARQLDAGSAIAIEGQGRRLAIPGAGGYYAALLNATTPRFLWSGFPYTVSSTGGSKIGAFSATETTGTAAVDFADISRNQGVPRSSDLTLKWTGGDASLQNGQVTIGGYSGNNDLTQWVWFQCTAPWAAKQFTVPAWVLSMLPPSGSGQSGTVTYPQGWIWIGQYSKPVTFTAPGLDRALFTDSFFNGLGIYFQ